MDDSMSLDADSLFLNDLFGDGLDNDSMLSTPSFPPVPMGGGGSSGVAGAGASGKSSTAAAGAGGGQQECSRGEFDMPLTPEELLWGGEGGPPTGANAKSNGSNPSNNMASKAPPKGRARGTAAARAAPVPTLLAKNNGNAMGGPMTTPQGGMGGPGWYQGQDESGQWQQGAGSGENGEDASNLTSHIDVTGTQDQHSSHTRISVTTGNNQQIAGTNGMGRPGVPGNALSPSPTTVSPSTPSSARLTPTNAASAHQRQQALMQQQNQSQALQLAQKQAQQQAVAQRAMQSQGHAQGHPGAVPHQQQQQQQQQQHHPQQQQQHHHQQQQQHQAHSQLQSHPHQHTQQHPQQQYQQQHLQQHPNHPQQQQHHQHMHQQQHMQQQQQQQQQLMQQQQPGVPYQVHHHAQVQALAQTQAHHIAEQQQRQQVALQQAQQFAQKQQQQSAMMQQQQQHRLQAGQGVEAGAMVLSPAQQRMQSPATPSGSIPPMIPTLSTVNQHIHTCQSRMVEALSRSSTLVSHIRKLCAPEVAMQLQPLLPNMALEAAQQSLTTAQAELAAFARLPNCGIERVPSGGSQLVASPSGQMVPYGMVQQGQQHGAALPRTAMPPQQQRRPLAGPNMQGMHSPHTAMSPHTSISPHNQMASPHATMQSPHSTMQHNHSAVPAMSPVGQQQHQGMHPHGSSAVLQNIQHGGANPMVGAGLGGVHQPGMHFMNNNMMEMRERGENDEDDLVVVSQSGTFSSDLPHARAHCVPKPFTVGKERVGVEGGEGNETYCPNCFCYVCDVKASECEGWLSGGHCHASDKDPYWKALREFARTDMLCNSLLLQALGCDEAAQMEAHRSCVNGLLAFHRYRDGDPGPNGIINHSFQHVTDVTSSEMKTIVGHLSGPKGPRTTLAVLDGITSAFVVNSWRPGSTQDSAKHKWCKGTYTAYKAIIEQLEKYWVLAIVHTSTRSVPPQALAIMAHRLRRLSKLATKEIVGRGPGMSEHIPLTHAISACERGWTHPMVVAILEGQCSDLTQREAQTLQRARLHVLERAQRWKEAYHYAIFHGHVAKSLAYMVRTGRHDDVLPMVFRQGALAASAKCVLVCSELAACNHADVAVRLSMYCAFGNYESNLDSELLIQSRMPYIQWLVEYVVGQLDATELQARNTHGSVTGAVESARRDAEEWAREVADDLPTHLAQPLAEAPLGSLYSPGTYRVERVAALCAVSMPALALSCAKVLSRHSDHCGAASVVLLVGMRSDVPLVTFALQDLLPKLGMPTFQTALQQCQPQNIPIAGQMSFAHGFLSAGEVNEAVRWATSANIPGAPTAEELPYAHFESTRNYRPCDLQAFVNAAEAAGNVTSALLLAELQMWWEPSWPHLQALQTLCSPQKFGLRRQQLQSLTINDNRCRADVRLEVLLREGMHSQAMTMISNLDVENAQAAYMALKTVFTSLGQEMITQPGVIDTLWPLLEQMVSQGDGVDAAMEVVAAAIPQRVLMLYDGHVDKSQGHCQQNQINQQTKNTLKSWLIRARRMYLAAGQSDQWERKFNELAQNLRRKSALSAVFADLNAPDTPTSHAHANKGGSVNNSSAPSPLPSTPGSMHNQ